MKNPYEVLGVPETATEEQIKAAYRELAKKYHPDNYMDSPLADVANEKMKEINEAYDAITSGTWAKNNAQGYGQYGSYGGSYGSYGGTYSSSASSNPDFVAVRSAIQRRRYDEAESILNAMPPASRGAEWNYLKGHICYNKGWFEQASSFFTAAYNMEPNNPEYRRAYANMNTSRSGGFRTERGGDASDSFCRICQGLICLDCCCDCMGGDLIPCC